MSTTAASRSDRSGQSVRQQIIATPLGLPPVPVPADNPVSIETITLGRRLYFDTSLSIDNSVSCATCNDPGHGLACAGAVSTGVGGKRGTRNSPTIINVAYSTTQFWDGRKNTLEKQAEGPVQNPVEMAHSLAGVVARFTSDSSYLTAFERAYEAAPSHSTRSTHQLTGIPQSFSWARLSCGAVNQANEVESIGHGREQAPDSVPSKKESAIEHGDENAKLQ